ncbi:YdcF family protein [Sulfitobacter sp. F26169L]|uniref:ElyC/SanA/YdcF family protein n=1 Tax=Sulfitobacter sp. F26169L TaxID=2996015 RepID=UPI002260DAD1|nr:ElyC/SanA/YdcF family protein [Sulfitobacter sp. F26169L]MCX7567507.1 YdcF family protein [Sulfitobacter sp. F26169L]
MLLDHILRTETDDRSERPPRTVVVFTGAYDRIYLGLDMIASDEADYLLISGANRTSGLIPHKFPALFDPTPEQAEWVTSGRIVLAPDAHSTFENALETDCWLDTLAGVDEVTIITSRRHMARASLALERATGSVSVVRMVSDPLEPYDRLTIDLDEFSKFGATWLVTLLPNRFWPGKKSALCK